MAQNQNELNIPKYDNLKKIGTKSKLLNFFQAREDEGYTDLNEWKIFRIANTFYVEVD